MDASNDHRHVRPPPLRATLLADRTCSRSATKRHLPHAPWRLLLHVSSVAGARPRAPETRRSQGQHLSVARPGHPQARRRSRSSSRHPPPRPCGTERWPLCSLPSPSPMPHRGCLQVRAELRFCPNMRLSAAPASSTPEHRSESAARGAPLHPRMRASWPRDSAVDSRSPKTGRIRTPAARPRPPCQLVALP